MNRFGPFWGVWSANATSNLADGLYQFAFPVMAVGLTGSPAAVAGVTIALTLAWPLFGLHAGSLVDRFDRRRMTQLVNGSRLAILAVVAVATLTGQLSLPLLYVAAILLGVGETLVDTALTAIVPSLVEPNRLEWANGRIAAGQAVGNTFVGPPLGGALVSVGWAAATGVSAALYALAVVALEPVRGQFRPRPDTAAGHDPWAARNDAGLGAGIRFLWRQPIVRRLTLFTAAMNVWWSAWLAVFVVFALAPGPMQLDPFGYGVLLTAMAIGGLAGSLLTSRILAVIGTRRALLLDLIGTVLLLGVPALTTHPVAVGAAVFAAGLGASVWVVVVGSIRQRLTPDPLLGRVYSASRMISWGVLPVGAALGGLVAELFGVRVLLALGSAASIGVLVAWLVAGPRGSMDAATDGMPEQIASDGAVGRG